MVVHYQFINYSDIIDLLLSGTESFTQNFPNIVSSLIEDMEDILDSFLEPISLPKRNDKSEDEQKID